MDSEISLYWCHRCRHEFHATTHDLVHCQICNSELIEEIEAEQPHPREFIPEMRVVRTQSIGITIIGLPVSIGSNLDALSLLLRQRIPQGPPPANHSQLSQLGSIIQQEIPEDLLECPVCKEIFQKEEDLALLPCTHIFHKECVVTWLNMHNSCPVCRISIPS